MKKIITLLITVAFLFPTLAYAHGGGCRKSSPPGQCCHKNHSTGVVHCHFKNNN